MMNNLGITFQKCLGCGEHFFPHRYVCLECGGSEFSEFQPEIGEVEQSTQLTAGPVILSVLAHDVRIVCAADEPIATGTTVVINDAAPEGRNNLPRVRLPGTLSAEAV